MTLESSLDISNAIALTRKHRAKCLTPQGPRTCLKVTVPCPGQEPLVAVFGGLTLQRKPGATLQDARRDIIWRPRTQLEKRLMAQVCEVCGSTENVQVHHVRKLADLTQRGRKAKPVWVQVMVAMRRKTLVVCGNCHADIHAGRPLQRTAK